MKINKIILYNFGSYEGENVFDTEEKGDRNIVLIGGKNGAGKTTLFTAMRIGLYGFLSMGYKNINTYYTRAITKLINNNAKLIRPVNAYVSLYISLNNGRGIDKYCLTRKWILNDTLEEYFEIQKNDSTLSSEEVADFEKFILSIIPPELFNLYFFDGEKIADFFLNEGSNARIKNAFLTLCGYDTFDIMRKNFKRISSGKSNRTTMLNDYISAKESLEEAKEKYADIMAKLKECADNIDLCEADIASVEKDYHQKGGVSQEEWDEKIFTLKEEEKKRESWNALLKKWANDIVPFLMIKKQIAELKKHIDRENSEIKYRNFCEVIDTPEIATFLKTNPDKIKEIAFRLFGSGKKPILELSIEQSAILLSQINQILSFDAEKVVKCKKAIKQSLAKTAKLRQELESSSISSVQEYMRKRAELFERKSAFLVQRVELERQILEQQENVAQAEAVLSRVQSKLEDELKSASISDISAKSIIMLDKLQQILYHRQIEKVEAFFRIEIKSLIRKTHFIDDIHIDDDFNIHIYRRETISANNLREIFATNSQEQVVAMLGEAALNKLLQNARVSTFDEASHEYCNNNHNDCELLVEIDKSALSNGEKQIFIMTLYHSLVQLCNHEIPFIIDTPFARIDTEHRHNISKYFFCGLHGQVFILSTNEEINTEHVKLMKDKIAATYMLENTDNKRTTIASGKYFEV